VRVLEMKTRWLNNERFTLVQRASVWRVYHWNYCSLSGYGGSCASRRSTVKQWVTSSWKLMRCTFIGFCLAYVVYKLFNIMSRIFFVI